MKRSVNFLINAANLHCGGGLQVAISFLCELSQMNSVDLSDIHVVVSSEVFEGCARLKVDTAVFGKFEVCDVYGVQAFYSKLNKRIRNYKLVFTIFGPNYLKVQADKEITGFAQPWIIYLENSIFFKMSFVERVKCRVKFFVQWLFFLRATRLIVELDHVKNSLVEKKNYKAVSIDIVHNTVSSLYFDQSKWGEVSIIRNEGEIALGIISRDYSHKNLGVLPGVARLLKKEYNLRVMFYTTLNEKEWSTKDNQFKEYVSTVGAITPDQCPSFYNQLDGVIFPSLLECFSATPLEAMVMKKPLFASDLGFVRDVCSDYAFYFNPMDEKDIAERIANYFKGIVDDSSRLDEAKLHASNFSNAKTRAEEYLKIIHNEIKGI